MDHDIFISYSWNNKDIADKIYSELTLIGLKILKDNHEVKYKDSLKDFMFKIRDSKYSILLISKDYLKSVNCMFEVMQLLKDEKSIWNKILPINIDAKYYDIIDRIEYVKYWQEKDKVISQSIADIDITNAISSLEELKNIKIITQNIDSFLTKLKDILVITPSKLFSNSYKELLDKVKIQPDDEKLLQLIPIEIEKNPNKKLSKINKFIKTYKFENSFCYGIKATAYKDLKQKEKAVENYKKAIELNNLNVSAWNNLGQVYEIQYCNYDEAKYAYENAILADPFAEMPLLNLGVLYKNHFKNIDKAIEINESILKFDANNYKAHSNLASIYRLKDKSKFIKHVQISVNQNYIPAILMYANYLKVDKGNIELGNEYYLKVNELDKEGYYKEMIEILLKSNKG
ncbi:toll/interleukin-1 receptor domain-containing protein [Chryseobacterium luquanense]|uniref:TIR domain-containing protein n=1 Tax=Chryseobacterium luquanense TaxID=2983766 RepID=A0ABT3Y2E0_9FLAO|nr:toll/interleukin-1 receptor domain-containing protein [Chryseobacterium luquanense]MCX8532295.1 TIR domain-containing protein [Chryseobacterium luquanense]